MRKVTLLCGISLCIFSGTYTFAQNDAKLVAVNYTPEVNSLYRLSFTAVDTLMATAVMHISLPPQFDVSGVCIAGSSTVNGGFSVSVLGDTIRIARSGLGSAVSPGESVEINFAVVKNPQEMTDEYSAEVTVFSALSSPRRNFFTVPVTSAIR